MALITVTGPPGSGKSTVCRLLKDRTALNYVYAGQIFRDRAAQLGLSLSEFGELCEKDPSFDRDLDDRMVALARKGGIIIEGRMSGALCLKHGISAFKVYIDASPEVRAKRMVEREGGDVSGKAKEILERERSEISRYVRYYGIDYTSRDIYDLWIDSSFMTPEEEVTLIMKGADL